MCSNPIHVPPGWHTHNVKRRAGSSQRRWFIYLPALYPDSFVFFYTTGASGRSWSIRMYSGGTPIVRYAKEFPWSDSEVLRRAEHKYPAERHNTNDIAWYEARIGELNRRHLLAPMSPGAAAQPPTRPVSAFQSPFPFLDRDELLALPKARKPTDMHRILTSQRSEDYVTWNMFRALQRRHDWWSQVVGLARQSGAQLVPAEDDLPELQFWRLVASPGDYERGSRDRMAASDIPAWQARALNPDPVEGETEVDLSFEGATYLVFAEAKLGSDISTGTTYDPARNQIARNIDCLLEEAGDKVPYFWMIVRDRDKKRAYIELLRRYAEQPAPLLALLAHRAEDQVAEVAARTAVIVWRDLLQLVPDTEELALVVTELRKRVGDGL